jgi:NADPH:quinone reductase-like Zn-dependent oxidoreductase
VRAVQIDRHGGPEVLTVREVPEPVAGSGEVLVRAVASSLNPVDWKTRAWEVGPALPATLGWDLAGIVVASDFPALTIGERVIAMSAQVATGRGTWYDLVALPAHLVASAPSTVSLAEAAALPLAGLTAVQALAKLRPASGERLLVTGAAGSVGGRLAGMARTLAIDSACSGWRRAA